MLTASWPCIQFQCYVLHITECQHWRISAHNGSYIYPEHTATIARMCSRVLCICLMLHLQSHVIASTMLTYGTLFRFIMSLAPLRIFLLHDKPLFGWREVGIHNLLEQG